MKDIDQPIEKLKQAYRVLDVPEAASALVIKFSYRKLIKRWHPDRPATGGSTAAEAALMTRLLNEAFEKIRNAPLRYYSGVAEPHATAQPAQSSGAEAKVRSINEVDLSQMFFNEKRIEYAVRIVCGALSGIFFGLALSFDLLRQDIEVVVTVVLCAIGFAAGAVKYGDKFWRSVFGRWFEWQ